MFLIVIRGKTGYTHSLSPSRPPNNTLNTRQQHPGTRAHQPHMHEPTARAPDIVLIVLPMLQPEVGCKRQPNVGRPTEPSHSPEFNLRLLPKVGSSLRLQIIDSSNAEHRCLSPKADRPRQFSGSGAWNQPPATSLADIAKKSTPGLALAPVTPHQVQP
eukprot:scaffold24670_cov67-Phaeocystis_antarctica.AAC.2